MSALAKSIGARVWSRDGDVDETGLKGRYDATMFAAAMALLVLGTLLVFSSTVRTGLSAKYGHDPFYFLTHHVIHVAAGLIAFWMTIKVPVRWWLKAWPWVLPISVVLLFGVFFVGESRNGARRWFSLFGITLQPSEFVKVGFALYLAGYLAKRKALVNNLLMGIVPLTIMFVVVAGLLVFQPDVGSVVLLGALVVSMLIVGGTRFAFMGVLFGLGALALVAILIYDPEKMSRFIGWMMIDETRLGEGFHIWNSQIVIGSGGLFGEGLGRGLQHVLGYLPEAETDFMFAVASEEIGFVGVVCIVLLYVVIAVRGFALIRICRDDFTRFLAFALTLLMSLPALMHMMVGLGLIPTKGLVLPFMSYGGSALVAEMVTLGLVQRMHLEATRGLGDG
ncbi:MAG: cell division protein FtsW [Deltaproteobacteria bacterium]|nr:cell division protein FtsW [Deltaproteobacteria bacterium]